MALNRDEKGPRSEKAHEEMFCKVARTPLRGLGAPRSFAKKSMNLQFRVMRLLCDTLKNIIDCLVPPVCWNLYDDTNSTSLLETQFAFQSSMVRHDIVQDLKHRDPQLRRQKYVVGVKGSWWVCERAVEACARACNAALNQRIAQALGENGKWFCFRQ